MTSKHFPKDTVYPIALSLLGTQPSCTCPNVHHVSILERVVPGDGRPSYIQERWPCKVLEC